jgi:hypothetical protein
MKGLVIVFIVCLIAIMVVLSLSLTGTFAFSSHSVVSNQVTISSGYWNLAAQIKIEPETIKLHKNPEQDEGVFTAFISLPDGYDESTINVASVKCQGAPAIEGHCDGPKKFSIKFNRQDLVGVIPGENVVFIVTGKLFNGTSFSGSDTVKKVIG